MLYLIAPLTGSIVKGEIVPLMFSHCTIHPNTQWVTSPFAALINRDPSTGAMLAPPVAS